MRYYSYRTLRDYPLVVSIGVAEQDVLFASSQRRTRNYLGAGLVSALMALFSILLLQALQGTKRAVVKVEQTMADLNAVHGRLAEQASLLDKAQDAIVVRDLSHRVTYWNKSAERLYGWSAAEVLDTVARDRQTDTAAYDEGMRRVLEHGDWAAASGVRGRARVSVEPLTLVHEQGRPALRRINTDITGDGISSIVPRAAGEHRHARRRSRTISTRLTRSRWRSC